MEWSILLFGICAYRLRSLDSKSFDNEPADRIFLRDLLLDVRYCADRGNSFAYLRMTWCRINRLRRRSSAPKTQTRQIPTESQHDPERRRPRGFVAGKRPARALASDREGRGGFAAASSDRKGGTAGRLGRRDLRLRVSADGKGWSAPGSIA